MSDYNTPSDLEKTRAKLELKLEYVNLCDQVLRCAWIRRELERANEMDSYLSTEAYKWHQNELAEATKKLFSLAESLLP